MLFLVVVCKCFVELFGWDSQVVVVCDSSLCLVDCYYLLLCGVGYHCLSLCVVSFLFKVCLLLDVCCCLWFRARGVCFVRLIVVYCLFLFAII